MKKCIICGAPAKYKIKDTNNYYCEECAEEMFSDLNYLIKVNNDIDDSDSETIEKLNDLKNDQKFLDAFIKEYNHE